ncbi:MAG: 50S ribosomal protein L5 [Candidatus Zambryskibacteria bacterium CG10_big_fil_rev_8_21_14_0_10_42_12]|uniref:Large ribosomal subunit protein uL5 n=1 Tax=Candidatus Zambryskibacteria bacterium CG10_big_fil_rev_8_21_14_0_10_42_12 TaxID=1975115 RepID=A0A2H0QWC9_9BACT|nr:MAG: 50S ribosomal protein L5 [Candidatus Zambryskibacteria bacterium CG10_big_fil_rev_8_21_14_0_10_42_12]
MEMLKDKMTKTFEALKGTFGYVNVMQSPKIEKVVISVGTGSMKDPKKVELAADRLARITGQKPASRSAKQSIASFKLREGDQVGYQVTLRGARMYDFLDRLINIALPRTKDFQGIKISGIDEMGNYTLGIKEHTIFFETSDEDIRDVFGMSITVVTTAKTREEAKAFLEHLGFPFKK